MDDKGESKSDVIKNTCIYETNKAGVHKVFIFNVHFQRVCRRTFIVKSHQAIHINLTKLLGYKENV